MLKKSLFFFLFFLTGCISTTTLGPNSKGDPVYKTTCYSGGVGDFFSSYDSCLEKAKEQCPVMKYHAIARGRDFHGFFYEVLYVCNDEDYWTEYYNYKFNKNGGY